MMVGMALRGAFVVALVVIVSVAAAYEPTTHRALSEAAFDESGILPILQYYGMRDTDRFPRRVLSFLSNRLTARQWVTRGGSDEDVPFFRVLNHFYDPVHDEPVGVLGGAKAPDWALEDRGDFEIQSHSYKDARQALYDGLTFQTRGQRERELGHMFYALGHVIHLIQDMAQPQHTRGDMHPPLWPLKSFIEGYVEANIDAFQQRLDEVRLSDGWPAPAGRIRDLWVSKDGRGFAQFSNASFVSAGTNFTALQQGAKAERFDSPELDLTLKGEVPAGTQCEDGRSVAPAPMAVYGNKFTDLVDGKEKANPRMTTHSIFDQRLQARGKRPIFALNCFNIDAAADILLPRAVAYSAALLKYFFRGQVDTEIVGSGFQFRNRTPGEAMSGTFELYYDATDGSRVKASSWSRMIEPDGRSDTLQVPAPVPGKDPVERGRYLVVFRGKLGEETDGVAGKWVRLAPRPVILVSFKHEGQWWWGFAPDDPVEYGRYYQGILPENLALMRFFEGEPGFFKRLEHIFVTLYKVHVPSDPRQPLDYEQIPFYLIDRLETSPPPLMTHPAFFMNFAAPGGGTSFLDAEKSWRLTVHWNADWAPLSGNLLGYDADGQVDVSPRVVRLCPGREWSGTIFFAPQELQHPWLNHCPDWLTFGD